MDTGEILSLAIDITNRAFYAVTDKGGKPYTEHLEFVAKKSVYYLAIIKKKDISITYDSEIIYSLTTDDANIVRTVARLHDLVEDVPHWKIETVRNVFHTDRHGISNAVELLTKSDKDSYEERIKRISHNELAMAVKLADLEHNMDIKRLKVIEQEDLERIKKYHAAYTFLMNQI